MIAWLSVNKNGDEYLFPSKPWREDGYWASRHYHLWRKLPKGFIENFLGYKMTWDDQPVNVFHALEIMKMIV